MEEKSRRRSRLRIWTALTGEDGYAYPGAAPSGSGREAAPTYGWGMTSGLKPFRF